jgi:hypothetical protein
MPKNRKGGDAVTRFEDLIKDLSSRDVLSPEHSKAIWRIKEHGDIAAHLAERDSKVVVKPMTYNSSRPILPFSESQSRKDLEDSIGILHDIADAIEHRPELMGPNPQLANLSLEE